MLLVSNRIRLLESEENRVMKKIKEARKRADQIEVMMKNSEERYNRRTEIEQ